MSQTTATTSVAYLFYEPPIVRICNDGNIAGRQSKADCRLSPRPVGIVFIKYAFLVSPQVGIFAATWGNGNTKSACTDTFLMGHCVLQSERHHLSLCSSRRRPFYGPQAHVIAGPVGLYTAEPATSADLQQCSYERVPL